MIFSQLSMEQIGTLFLVIVTLYLPRDTLYVTQLPLSHNCNIYFYVMLYVTVWLFQYFKYSLAIPCKKSSCKSFDLSLVKLYLILLVFLAYCKNMLNEALLVREVIEVNHVGWMQISGSLKKHAYPNSATPNHVWIVWIWSDRSGLGAGWFNETVMRAFALSSHVHNKTNWHWAFFWDSTTFDRWPLGRPIFSLLGHTLS